MNALARAELRLRVVDSEFRWFSWHRDRVLEMNAYFVCFSEKKVSHGRIRPLVDPSIQCHAEKIPSRRGVNPLFMYPLPGLGKAFHSTNFPRGFAGMERRFHGISARFCQIAGIICM
jgi:hypothetical protein